MGCDTCAAYYEFIFCNNPKPNGKIPLAFGRGKPCDSELRVGLRKYDNPGELYIGGLKMDWFHCNQCFTRRGSKFAVSSCGHICCEACIKSKQCSVCGASCSYLPITDEMKPQEKVFFKDPVKLIQSRLEHISQIAQFQRIQMERVTAHFKHKSVELERRLKEVTEQGYRQLSELKRENADLKKQLSELRRETADLKKPLSQRRVSPGQFRTDGTQRMSLPVAVTSPVTPRSRTMSYIGSAESQGWARDRGRSLSSLTGQLNNFYRSSPKAISMTTPSTDEDYEIWLKPLEEANSWISYLYFEPQLSSRTCTQNTHILQHSYKNSASDT